MSRVANLANTESTLTYRHSINMSDLHISIKEEAGALAKIAGMVRGLKEDDAISFSKLERKQWRENFRTKYDFMNCGF